MSINGENIFYCSIGDNSARIDNNDCNSEEIITSRILSLIKTRLLKMASVDEIRNQRFN